MNIKELRTIDGYLKVGYTKEDCYMKREIRLFDKVDTDGDGILSAEEIIARRNKEANNKTIWNAVGLVAGIALLTSGIKKKKISPECLGLGLGLLLGPSCSQITLKNEIEKTKAYEKEINKLNTNS